MAVHCGEMLFTLTSLKVPQIVFFEPWMNTSNTGGFLERTFHLNLTFLIRIVFSFLYNLGGWRDRYSLYEDMLLVFLDMKTQAPFTPFPQKI